MGLLFLNRSQEPESKLYYCYGSEPKVSAPCGSDTTTLIVNNVLGESVLSCNGNAVLKCPSCLGMFIMAFGALAFPVKSTTFCNVVGVQKCL